MSLQQYQKIYAQIERLVGGDLPAFMKAKRYVKLTSKPFMDLNIEYIRKNVIAMSHNYIQNGDLMADPDMEIEVNIEYKIAEPLTFQQDGFPPLYQRVYEYDDNGNKTGVRLKLKQQLKSFLIQWLKNIKSQGHKISETKDNN